MDTVIRDQILEQAVSISHSAKTFEKGMNPTILRSFMGKVVGEIWVFSLCTATDQGEGKFWTQNLLKPAYKLTLCRIYLVRRGW